MTIKKFLSNIQYPISNISSRLSNIKYPISNISSRLSNIQYPISNILLIVLLILGFFYRIYGLSNNYSFWSDEEHVAIFARAILERGKPILANGFSTEASQWLQYWASALSSRVFGLNEFAIRFPSVIFGVLTIWAVYLLGKELFNKNVGLVAATLITFLKIEILWSRQARPYQALQFFSLLGAFFIAKLTKGERFNWRYFLGFLGCGILASLMHGMGLVIFFVGFLYLLIFRFSWFKKKWTALGLAIPLIFSYIFRVQILAIVSQIGKTNNLFYYRVFLTHNYPLLCLLAFLGGILLIWQKKYRELILFAVFLGVQIVIDSFFLWQPFTRYFYPVFPFLILLSVFALFEISQYLGSLIKWPKYLVSIIQYLILLVLAFPVIAFGHKFTFLPQPVYSLNEDMQETPEVDWKKIYKFADEGLKKNTGSVLITNWSDLPVWYLGEGEPDYLIRKDIKIKKDTFSGAITVPGLESLREVVKTRNKGLIILDSWDNFVPDNIGEYCQDNFKKELEIDRLYSVQPRYWPVTVYSWGMD